MLYTPLKENDYSQGIDLLKKAVFAFMNNKEYKYAREVLHILEDIDDNDEPSDKLKEAAQDYYQYVRGGRCK